MSAVLLFFIKEKTDNLVEQTETSSQKTLEFKINLSRQTFSVELPPSLQKSYWLLAVTVLGFYNWNFYITKGIKTFHSLLIVTGLIL